MTDPQSSAPGSDPFVGHPLTREEIDTLYGLYWERLYAVLSREDLTTEAIEDAIGDGFTALLDQAAKGDPPVIRTNTLQFLLDHIRYRARRERASSAQGAPALDSGILDPAQRRPQSIALGAEALTHVMEKALAEMSEQERLIFTRHQDEGISIVDLANDLGITVQACRDSYGRAMRKLRMARTDYSSSFVEASTYSRKPTSVAGALRAITNMPDDARDVLHARYVAKTPPEEAARALALDPARYRDRLKTAERLFALKYRLELPKDLEALLASDNNDV